MVVGDDPAGRYALMLPSWGSRGSPVVRSERIAGVECALSLRFTLLRAHAHPTSAADCEAQAAVPKSKIGFLNNSAALVDASISVQVQSG